MAAAPRVAHPHVVSDSSVQGGEPVVAGTRIPVRAVVVAWQEYGDEKMVLEAYPRLSATTLAEALAYYEAHRSEIDENIRAQADA
jgi:uncharacterized protein (DUF433 family)